MLRPTVPAEHEEVEVKIVGLLPVDGVSNYVVAMGLLVVWKHLTTGQGSSTTIPSKYGCK